MDLSFKLHYWPILTGLWLFFIFIITYIVAVTNNHVDGYLPYISDTGNTPPESCLFSQFLNIGAVLMFVIVYLRFKVVEILETTEEHPKYRRANVWSFWMGVVAAIGMSMVANFQELAVPGMHFLGSFLAFGIGTIYFMFQSYIGFRSEYTPNYLKWLRIALNFLFVFFYVMTSVCSSYAFAAFEGPDQLHWKKDDGGYEWHLGATYTEWLIAVVMDVYILTYTSEFRLVKFDEILFTKSAQNENSSNDNDNKRYRNGTRV